MREKKSWEVIHQPPGSGLWLSDPFRQDSWMRMIRIVESYERGVYILRDGEDPRSDRVGGIMPMLREAHQRVRGRVASVLVMDADGDVRKCLRYLPDGSVVEERPESIYLSAD